MFELFTMAANIYAKFRGYKTYIAGAGIIFLALGGWLVNCVVPLLDAGGFSLLALRDFYNLSVPYFTLALEGLAAVGFRDFLAQKK